MSTQSAEFTTDLESLRALHASEEKLAKEEKGRALAAKAVQAAADAAEQAITTQQADRAAEISRDTPFPELKNTTLLQAARGEPISRVPVWVHRQAGRYLTEYKTTRAECKDFFDLCRTPKKACKVTLDPIKLFDLDAAIIFSDILVVPQAMGMDVEMIPGKGPSFPSPLLDPSHLSRLSPANVHESLGYVYDAIRLTRHAIDGKVPLLGFTGAPWTLMAYMITGSGAKTYSKAKAWFYHSPRQARELLQAITTVIIDHLVAQIEAGAQMVEVFDSWAGDLTTETFLEFELPCLIQINQQVKARLTQAGRPLVPMTIFAKSVSEESLTALASSGYDVISVDWTISPRAARAAVGPNITLQGNLDSAIFFAPEPVLRKYTREMVEAFGPNRYIANLGHGMLPSHPREAVAIFCDEVHKTSERLLQAQTHSHA